MQLKSVAIHPFARCTIYHLHIFKNVWNSLSLYSVLT